MTDIERIGCAVCDVTVAFRKWVVDAEGNRVRWLKPLRELERPIGREYRCRQHPEVDRSGGSNDERSAPF